MADTLETLDHLFDSGKSEEALKGLEEANQKDPGNVEILWRLSRAVFEIGTQNTGKEDFQKSSYERAYKLAEEAIAKNKDHYGGHKWAGISLGYLGDFISMTERIGNSFKIKAYFDAAAALAPGDPTILHALGKWCYTIASIGFLERTAASTLFAEPPTSSYDEAITYFLKADGLILGDNKNFQRWLGIYFSNCLLLGQSYEAKGDKAKAKEWFKKLLEQTPAGAGQVSQKENQEKARARLEALESSWW